MEALEYDVSMKQAALLLGRAMAADFRAIVAHCKSIARDPQRALMSFLGSPAGMTLIVMLSAMSGDPLNIGKALGADIFAQTVFAPRRVDPFLNPNE